MVSAPTTRLPLHDFMTQLDSWRVDRSDDQRRAVAASLERVAVAYGASGAYVRADLAPAIDLAIGVGDLRDAAEPPQRGELAQRDLVVAGVAQGRAKLWARGAGDGVDALAEALSVALSAAWAQHAAMAQRRELEALDGAVRGIASIGSVDTVLQLIVDRVRDLVDAQYAALGIVGHFGRIEQFITSGITREQRAAIGPVPEGHGLLGLIIREDTALLIDDIAVDSRRYGFPPNHPEMHSLLGVPVRSKSRTIGNLYLTNKRSATAFSTDDLRLVERFALHAGIAIENARLHEEIARLAIVEERQRISQDLHDSIIQSLYAISLSLEDLPEVITEDPPEGALRADRAIDAIHATIRDIRNFIMGLQPELLELADLPTGMRQLGAEFQANTLIDLEVHLGDDMPDLSEEHAAHLLAITREALSNIARHSGATRASLDLTAADGTLRLVIGDNGHGFDVAQARSARQRGLGNLHSRAEALGGVLTLNSELGAGTRLELTIPLVERGPAGHTEDREGEHHPAG